MDETFDPWKEARSFPDPYPPNNAKRIEIRNPGTKYEMWLYVDEDGTYWYQSKSGHEFAEYMEMANKRYRKERQKKSR